MARSYLKNRIRELRIERNLTLEGLGKLMKSGLTASTISKLEKRKMALSADYIAEFADVFGVTFEDVVRPAEHHSYRTQARELEDGDLCLVRTGTGEVTACRFEKNTLSFNPQSRRHEGDRIRVGAEPFIILANLGAIE